MNDTHDALKEEVLYSYEYQIAYERFLRYVYSGFHMLDPLLRRLPPLETEHCHRAIYTETQPTKQESGTVALAGLDGSEPELTAGQDALELRGGPNHFRATAHFDPRNIDVEEHTIFLHDLAQAYVASLKPRTEHHCREVALAHGNTFHVGNEPLSWDHILSWLEQVPLQFDEQGHINWPLLLPDKKVQEQIVRLFTEGRPSPQQRQRLEQIIETHRKKHHAGKRTRRLSRSSVE